MGPLIKKLVLLFIFSAGISIASSIFSQDASLAVTVTDEMDNPLPGTTVTLKGPGKAETVVRTDDEGTFVFPKLADGNYNISVNASGFDPKNGKIAVSYADKTEYRGNFKLKKSNSIMIEVPVKTSAQDNGKIVYYAKSPDINIPDEILPPESKKRNKTNSIMEKLQKKENAVPAEDTRPDETTVQQPASRISNPMKILLFCAVAATGFITLVLLLLLARRWGRSEKGGRLLLLSGSLGCGCLTLILAIIMVVLLFYSHRSIETETSPAQTEETP